MAASLIDLGSAGPEIAEPAAAGPQRARLRALRNGKTLAGVIIVLFFVVLAVVGPWLAPYSPDASSAAIVAPPSAQHWFGTDQLGRDVFSQMMVGARGVVVVAFAAGLVATALSVLIGITSGYLPGRTGEGLSALSNVFLVIPALPLIIIITTQLTSGAGWIVTLVIGLTSWAWNARLLRAQTLSLRRRDFVEAARASGEKTWRVITFEILPNLTAIIASGFIGVSSVSTWNWGTVLYWAQSQDALGQNAWWWFVPAGLAIALFGTGLALLNFGIDEFVNPRLRSAGPGSVKAANGRRVRMRVGFTPVLAEVAPDAAGTPAGATGSVEVEGERP